MTARTRKLSVYVTPAGFYDAVVAAPNQKAALKAWGARADLFAEKLAGPEDDARWREKALAAPGEVLKKPRGDAAERLARPAPAHRPLEERREPRSDLERPRQAPASKRAPDRSRLDAAEAAAEAAKAVVERVESEFAERRRELEAEEAEAVRKAKAASKQAETDRKREAAVFGRATR